MNRSIKVATGTIALSLMTSTLLHATNGDTLIAVGAKARGMGGTGIAISHGAESTLINPALITSVENTEISFGGTVFMRTSVHQWARHLSMTAAPISMSYRQSRSQTGSMRIGLSE